MQVEPVGHTLPHCGRDGEKGEQGLGTPAAVRRHSSRAARCVTTTHRATVVAVSGCAYAGIVAHRQACRGAGAEQPSERGGRCAGCGRVRQQHVHNCSSPAVAHEHTPAVQVKAELEQALPHCSKRGEGWKVGGHGGV